MIVLANDHLGKSLHGVLFNRLTAFAAELTPEAPAGPIVEFWLNRFYSNDGTIQLLVELNQQYEIIAHAVLEIQHFAGIIVLSCHQYQSDKSDIHRVDEFVEYIRKLKHEIGAAFMTFTTVKNIKAYEKRYGFKAIRTIMLDFDTVPEEPS
jgi:hypothetical protein